MIGRILGRNASRRRRRLLVLIAYLGLASFLVFGLSAEAIEDGYDWGPRLALLGQLAFFFVMGLGFLAALVLQALRAYTQNVADKRDSMLDERQRAVRDRAYRLAYWILVYTLLAVAAYWFFAVRIGVGWLWLPPGEAAGLALMLGILFVTTLPTAIVAWNEPDPEPDLEDEEGYPPAGQEEQGASTGGGRSRRYRLLVFGAAAVVLGLLVVGGFAGAENYVEQKNERAQARWQNEEATIGHVTNLKFDPRSEEELVRNSEEVFVGRVEEITGREPKPATLITGWSPRAQFAVSVLEVIKDDSEEGSLEEGGAVTVNQPGVPPEDAKATARLHNLYIEDGTSKEDGVWLAAEYLEPGNTYVFATEYAAGEGWHRVRVHPFGWMVLGGDDGGADPLEEEQVRELKRAATES